MFGNSHILSKISIESIRNQIHELEAISRESCSIDDLKSRIIKLKQGYSCLTRIISSEYAYRVRKNSSEKLFTNVQQLWYPPSESVKSQGRLNRAGRSMFYIAASEQTAILEMRPHVGDIMTVLRCKLKNPSFMPHVMELGYAEKASQHQISSWVNLLDDTSYGKDFLGNQDNLEKNLAIRSFLAREFTRIVERGNEHEFSVTIAISEIMMDSEQIDGVMYPSMAGDVDNWQGGANMALKPESADRLYESDICWVAKVEQELGEFPDKKYALRCIHTTKAITSSGEICW